MSDKLKTSGCPDSARAAERARCAKIVRHYLVAHRRLATLTDDQLAIAGHGQAVETLDTVLQRIEEP